MTTFWLSDHAFLFELAKPEGMLRQYKANNIVSEQPFVATLESVRVNLVQRCFPELY